MSRVHASLAGVKLIREFDGYVYESRDRILLPCLICRARYPIFEFHMEQRDFILYSFVLYPLRKLSLQPRQIFLLR